MEATLKQPKWPWSLTDGDLQLFANEKQKESDQKLAKILTLSLEAKFLGDLGLDTANKNENDIRHTIENWATQNVR